MKVYRKANHMTQKELAEMVGVKHLTLRAWEQNVASPPYEIWKQIKSLLFGGIAG
ncbi:helix-turn-helix transcriptional regulator [Intestinimonas butyriciproducens]